MNCQHFEQQLGDYVDGTLAAVEATALEVHLASCSRCRSAADDFEAIRLMAQTLEPYAPPNYVWQRVAAATTTRGSWSLLSPLAWSQPVAAAAMLVLVTGGLSWVGGRLATGVAAPGAQFAATAPALAPQVGPARQAEAEYTMAIASLEQVTTAERSALDPDTAEVLQTGMTVIDGAIAESRAALDADPGNDVAQESLFQALRRKVALLQQMLALINEMRKGNPDGAARILSELNR
jgi:anti-sigma factor RsiW